MMSLCRCRSAGIAMATGWAQEAPPPTHPPGPSVAVATEAARQGEMEEGAETSWCVDEKETEKAALHLHSAVLQWAAATELQGK